jgi:hypothetical protein
MARSMCPRHISSHELFVFYYCIKNINRIGIDGIKIYRWIYKSLVAFENTYNNNFSN